MNLINPNTSYPNWAFKIKGKKLKKLHFRLYECIQRIMIIAQRNKYVKSDFNEEFRYIYIGDSYLIDLKTNIQY